MTKKKKDNAAGGERIDTADLLSRVNIVDVIESRIPLKKNGVEYECCCPFHTEKTPSFKVNPVKQIYHCFGCGAGGDAIKFLQEYEGLEFLDACRALGADIPEAGSESPSRKAPSPAKRAGRAAEPANAIDPVDDKRRTEWEPVLPVPEKAPEPPLAHITRGRYSKIWAYRDADGRLLGYAARFETSDGGKEILPLTFCKHAITGAYEWRWISFPEPMRPIYGLDRLAAKPDAFVLLVEGEKCADAAQAELPELVVITWPGGGKAVRKVDWSPLAGRKIGAWADCDAKRERLTPAERDAGLIALSKPLLPEEKQPGVIAMRQIRDRVLELGARWWDMKIPAPGEKPDGWDVADAIEDGMRAGVLADYIKANLVELKSRESISTPIEASASSEEGGDEWRHLLFRNDKLKLIDHRDNVFLILEYHPEWRGKIARDSFANRIVLLEDCPIAKAGILEEEHALRLSLWLAQQMSLIVKNLGSIVDGVRHVAFNHQFHPVRDWLASLEWDGIERRFDWLTDYLGVRKCEYSMMSGSHFLIALVARVMKPGSIMRQMPILEGGQYAGKSTAIRVLGGEWFGDTPIRIGDKDAYQVLPGKWIYEIAELDAFNRAESTAMKAFISSPTDTYRASYDKAAKDWHRQVVFVGTVNHDEYFKDSTGNTRYVPWRCEQDGLINFDGLAEVRDQLFAEAYQRYLAGDHWWPTREEQKRLYDPQQAQREIAEIWVELLADGLDATTSPRVSMTDLIQILKLDASKIDNAKSVSTRIGNCMKKLGWEIDRDTAGTRKRYYMRPKSDIPSRKSADVGGEDDPY
jgi:putative DNA primase/helicase